MALLDETALLTVCAYIDLNPVAAGISPTPEESPHTSCKARVDHVKSQDRVADLAASAAGSVAGSAASAGLEEGLWLCPLEDRRSIDSSREGMLAGFSLGSYLQLVDATGRLLREGKAQIHAELSPLLVRLGLDADLWERRMRRLFGGRFFGRFFAGSREQLRQAAARLGVHHLANLAGCPA